MLMVLSIEHNRFNPRTRVGCDDYVEAAVYELLAFQSTHPRGVRRKSEALSISFWLFQSTHPRGVRRPLKFDHRFVIQVSIHAPAWGAT